MAAIDVWLTLESGRRRRDRLRSAHDPDCVRTFAAISVRRVSGFGRSVGTCFPGLWIFAARAGFLAGWRRHYGSFCRIGASFAA